MAATTQEQNSFLKSTFPVYFPAHPALAYNATEFKAFLEKDVHKFQPTTSNQESDRQVLGPVDDATTLVSEASATTTGEVQEALKDIGIGQKESLTGQHPFMDALQDSNNEPKRDMENMMQTENADLAYRSTTEPLVDLFSELEEVVSGPRLRELLESAWQKDPLSTLKIIFNARSIHLGKSSRVPTYKSFGWLARNHPVTLLTNLQWLSRPVIGKKIGEKNEDEVLVEAEKDENDQNRFDVKNGVAHGYWKDLLNILALAVDGKLDVLANPRDLLNIKQNRKKSGRVWDSAKAKELRKETKAVRHAAALKAFDEHSFYRALHLTVARLFADQLKSDLALLRCNDKKGLRQISLCAKWAPSTGLFHDKHTFIVSTIAEALHPPSEFADLSERELYLRHARESYRKDVSALRKALAVVERDIAADNFETIKYDRVPSLAMNRYAGLFAKKDTEGFDRYISSVAEGKKSISGATLLPSVLVSKVRAVQFRYGPPSVSASAKKSGTKVMVETKLADIDAKVAGGQWKTLVQRITDSGKLENSIAVADVSGSMIYPKRADGTTPMDSSIGLSLLLAEVTAPPFGGSFITFSSNPTVEQIRGSTLQERIANLETAHWEGSTDFVAVFDKLILPMAKKHNVKQEDMVKQIFVFSDMQFNLANRHTDHWTTSYERIKKEFEAVGYQMPKLIFWNLAGGRAGVTGHGDPTAPKPVTADEEGTALVSGYSQGMLKVFLDNGAFEDPEAGEEVTKEEVEGDDGQLVQVNKKQKMNPMSTVRKAISHKAYSMLKVVD
ncbi:hypothetical protein LTR70_004978 [Exophiala xenobiotica]|uniref:Uncharacterized protein n=1 Tax=Lithohypha guttulata TaxID=1690604 RepID=A0ABR0KBY4_9EURO|nr:hypothetical protein LTR24_004381 [Lithohypha guttulata]KAK5319359.1 hypothetical protein LTR70_004978 [Exophiala xenobiotica]